MLFVFHFLATATSRMIILTRASRRLKSGKIYYNTVIIGGNQKAVELFDEISGLRKSLGYRFVGFVDANGQSKNGLQEHLPRIGHIRDLSELVEKYNIEEAIIAIETSEHDKLEQIMNDLFDYETILVKIIPDMYDILLGTVKMNYLYGAVLIEIERGLMPKWEFILKRLMDISVSIIMLILLLPPLPLLSLLPSFSTSFSLFLFSVSLSLLFCYSPQLLQPWVAC